MTARVAIVGSGLGGFVGYATLRHGGLDPGEIVVLGDEPDPAGAWRPRAAAIRQRLMRSESDGHCWPTSFPGLAAWEASRRWDLAPLILSVCDRYRPTVEVFLAHVDELRASSRWDQSFRQARVDKGRNRDTAWYAMIDREWPAIDRAFQRWLDPSNFDAEGRQRTSLSALTAPILVSRG